MKCWPGILILSCVVALGACSDDTPSGGGDGSVGKNDGQTASKDGATLSGDASSLNKDVGASKRDSTGGGAPKVLSSDHTGWQRANCSGNGCHTLPYHGNYSSGDQCVSCHGANGAPVPQAGGNHNSTANCLGSSCHSSGKHGYTDKAKCTACHYAAKGTT